MKTVFVCANILFFLQKIEWALSFFLIELTKTVIVLFPQVFHLRRWLTRRFKISVSLEE